MSVQGFIRLTVISVLYILKSAFVLSQDSSNLEQPFSSLVEARDAIRQLKKEQKLPNRNITLYIKGGIYTIDSTFQLTSEDSGTETATITYKPFNNEEVRFIGGKRITEFEPLKNSEALSRIDSRYHKNIYQVNLRAAGIHNYGTIKPTGFGREIQPTGLELFYNGEPMILARYPNEGWVRIDSVPQSGKLIERGLQRIKRGGIPLGRHYGRFCYKGNLPDQWIMNDDIWLHGYWTHDWADSYVRVANIDTLKNEFILSEPHGVYGYNKNQEYYAFNILEELDSPGEWYLDRKNGMLYFWPPSPIEEGTAYVSVLEEEMINMTHVSYVHFEDFIFEGTRGKGIVMKGGSNNRIMGCTIRNIGSQGITIAGGRHQGIVSCDLYNIGDEGITLSGGNRKTLSPAEHYVINNHIYNYSRINRTLRPAVKLTGVGIRLAHNRIHNAPHIGVIFDGNDHILEFNEVYNIAKETGDVGAFYTGRDWTKRGNIIRYNYFHHIHGPGAHGANAIYLDDAASGTTIYGNIFHEVDRGVLIGGGHDNVVENNIFINCKKAVRLDARGLAWAKNYIAKGGGWRMYEKLEAVNYNAPPYSMRYPELASILEGKNPAIPSGIIIRRNINYGNWLEILDGGDPKYFTIQNNYIMDKVPAYIDIEKVKIYPKKKSVLKSMKFEEIPLERIGLYNDKYRNDL